jgi:hypothetical protein
MSSIDAGSCTRPSSEVEESSPETGDWRPRDGLEGGRECLEAEEWRQQQHQQRVAKRVIVRAILMTMPAMVAGERTLLRMEGEGLVEGMGIAVGIAVAMVASFFGGIISVCLSFGSFLSLFPSPYVIPLL